MTLFGVSCILPAQTNKRDEGRCKAEKLLYAELIAGAIHDLFLDVKAKHSRKLVLEARRWIDSNVRGYVTFPEACFALGLDPGFMRRKIRDPRRRIVLYRGRRLQMA